MRSDRQIRQVDVLLIVPPRGGHEDIHFKLSSISGTASPLLGVAYLASVLESRHISVDIIDAPALCLDSMTVLELTKASQARIVGISATTPAIQGAIRFASDLKDALPSVWTVVGGVHLTALPVQTMQAASNIDFGVVGEGEETFFELCHGLLNHGADLNLATIQGLVWRNNAEETGKIVVNPRRPLIQDLDSLPFPARHLLPMECYSPSLTNYRAKPQTSFICSRGCPYQCIFCTKHVFGSRMRYRSMDNIIEELRLLQRDYGIREVDFYDETLTLRPDWMLDFCARIQPLRLSWQCNGRVEQSDLRMLKAMKKSGCWKINYGVETGNQKSLDLLKKKTTIKTIEEAFGNTRRAGISAQAFMMLGVPGENWDDMLRTIEFAIRIKADDAVFTVMTPYPGNEIYDKAEQYGTIRSTDWSEYVCINDDPIFVPFTTTTDEVARALELAYKKFVFRPRYIAHRLYDVIRCPHKLAPYTRAAMKLLVGG